MSIHFNVGDWINVTLPDGRHELVRVTAKGTPEQVGGQPGFYGWILIDGCDSEEVVGLNAQAHSRVAELVDEVDGLAIHYLEAPRMYRLIWDDLSVVADGLTDEPAARAKRDELLAADRD